jgi:hypothetical protein
MKKNLKFAKSHLPGSRSLQSQKLLFDREELLKKGVLHYKPCPLTSLSSRKSWGKLKNRFFQFCIYYF